MIDHELLKRMAKGLLQHHPFVGRRTRPLVGLLSACEQRTLPSGAVLCREGDPGEELFVLLVGEVRVLRRDADGQERELFVVQAPALLGHMSLVDGSRRSATCVAKGTAGLAVMSAPLYRRVMGEASPRGTALRRLIISSMTQQMVRTTGLLGELLDEQADRANLTREERFMRAAGVLDGWSMEMDGVDRVKVVQLG